MRPIVMMPLPIPSRPCTHHSSASLSWWIAISQLDQTGSTSRRCEQPEATTRIRRLHSDLARAPGTLSRHRCVHRATQISTTFAADEAHDHRRNQPRARCHDSRQRLDSLIHAFSLSPLSVHTESSNSHPRCSADCCHSQPQRLCSSCPVCRRSRSLSVADQTRSLRDVLEQMKEASSLLAGSHSVVLLLHSVQLQVHVVGHSHDDVGWRKTVDEYY